jgi:hypothetical protein
MQMAAQLFGSGGLSLDDDLTDLRVRLWVGGIGYHGDTLVDGVDLQVWHRDGAVGMAPYRWATVTAASTTAAGVTLVDHRFEDDPDAFVWGVPGQNDDRFIAIQVVPRGDSRNEGADLQVDYGEMRIQYQRAGSAETCP